jgi:hypothetical protein
MLELLVYHLVNWIQKFGNFRETGDFHPPLQSSF